MEKELPFSLWRFLLDEVVVSASMPSTKEFVKDKIRRRKYMYWPLCLFDVTLRGVSQVYLMDHPLSGALILLALFFTQPVYVYSALLGVLSSTAGAIFGLRGFTDSIFDGKYGYDGCLVGNAVFTFLDSTSDVGHLTLVTIACGVLAGVLQVALVHLFSKAELPALTISFNIAVTMMFVAVNSGQSSAAEMRPPGDAPPSPIEGPPEFTLVLQGTVKGIGQFIFADTFQGSAIIYFAILVCKRRDAFGALLGSFVATVVAAYVFRASPDILPAVRDGLWSYNGMGCGAAFASGVFTRRTKYNGVFGLFAAGVSVLSVSLWATILRPLPYLTFPFVTTVMLMLLARHAGEIARNSVQHEQQQQYEPLLLSTDDMTQPQQAEIRSSVSMAPAVEGRHGVMTLHHPTNS